MLTSELRTNPAPWTISQRRVLLVCAALFYGYSIHYAHVAYLNPVWDYFGFTYVAPHALDLVLMTTLIVAGAMLLPPELVRPSSIIVLLLFTIVYVPTVVLTLSLESNRLELYTPSLLMLALGFAAASLGARFRFSQALEARVPGDTFVFVIFLFWAACCAVLVVNYYDVMTLVSESDVYRQREAGAATSLAMGYVQTYFSDVLSPALIAVGLVKRRWTIACIGTAGCVLMYMITAQRTVMLLPVAMLAVNFALTIRWSFARTASALLVVLGITMIYASAYYKDSAAATLLSIFLVNRTIAFPGLTLSLYYDLFSVNGFTWWSHVKGFDLLVSPPAAYWNDRAWPNLGLMVGDRTFHNVTMNANAHLFAGDGVAAGGAVGVLVVGLALAAWLAWLDYTSRGWDRRFALLVLVPVALALTNGHLFTTLLSFGGLFWMVVFHFFKPGLGPSRTRK